jgi:hypothetical protein
MQRAEVLGAIVRAPWKGRPPAGEDGVDAPLTAFVIYISIDQFSMSPKIQGHYLHEVARKVGVAPITLRRWLLAGKISEVQRNRNGWRVFSRVDIAKIRRFANRGTRPTSK